MRTTSIESADAETVSYAYSYPHKSSYRKFTPPVPIADAWRGESIDRLALYVHLPFCEMRCGFCNLFTLSQPDTQFVEKYLSTLRQQMQVVRDQIGPATFRQFAVGGGTPTYLTASQLTRLLEHVENIYELSLREIPTSVEASPATVTGDRIRVLSEFGIERVSLGIQSLDETELTNLGRPQRVSEALSALASLRAANFPVVNVDLIYGALLQTTDGWLRTLREVVDFAPEELFLYPLYVRPETGLARRGQSAAAHRQDLYRAGRELLLSRGYRQTSLRCFSLPRTTDRSSYHCQSDGMVGLGCGARSYTRSLHYATRFAVTQAGIQAILRDWTSQSDVDLALATHGLRLNEEEQRRRFVIISLLHCDGLSIGEYKSRFLSSPEEDFVELSELRRRGWIHDDGERFALTETGLEQSDVVGPMLYSAEALACLREFVRL